MAGAEYGVQIDSLDSRVAAGGAQLDVVARVGMGRAEGMLPIEICAPPLPRGSWAACEGSVTAAGSPGLWTLEPIGPSMSGLRSESDETPWFDYAQLS